MSADQAPEAPPSAPRGYFDSEPAQKVFGTSTMVSKTGRPPDRPAGTVANLTYVGVPLPDKLYEDRALICIALRTDGYSYQEIQNKTGLSKWQVKDACRRARRAGNLRDVIDLIDDEVVPQAIENLREALDDPKHPNHWTATSETLHGRGVFRNFSNNKNEGGIAEARLPPLQINIINPGGGTDLPAVIVNSERGSVIGSPRLEPAKED